MSTTPEPTVQNLRLAARQLGAMLAQVGDFYDVTEEIAIGYATTSATPEHRIRQQMGALAELKSVADNVLEWRVEDARELLMSWSEIGDVLEISRQAAQQKYSK